MPMQLNIVNARNVEGFMHINIVVATIRLKYEALLRLLYLAYCIVSITSTIWFKSSKVNTKFIDLAHKEQRHT